MKFQNSSLRGAAEAIHSMVWIAASLSLLAMTVPANAQDKEKQDPPAETKTEPTKPDAQNTEEKKADDKSYRFAPDFCDFEITFPEKPAIANQCLPGTGCYEVNSYTMVYDLSTTVDVSVTCNPSTPKAYAKYTNGVMKAALAGMVDQRNLDTYDIGFKDFPKEQVKNGSLTGTGKTGASGKIYSGQLWIGQNSIFTVQAELIGDENQTADTAFRDILASIKIKEGKQLPKPKKPVQYQPKNNQ